MGCWLSRATAEAIATDQPCVAAKKVYSWDKREKKDPAKFIIEKVDGGEVGRMPGSVEGEQFVVRECNNCCIYLLDYLNTVTVDDCNNCTIIIGPTSGSVFVRQCRECVVVAACGQLRTRDCKGLQLRLLCNTQPIIEASTRVRFSCYQLYYKQLQDQFCRAGLSVFNNNWSEVHDFTPGDDEERNWTMAMPSVLPDLKLPSQYPFDRLVFILLF
ncbi:Tubulin binding cofactor C-like domain [Trinorchestia longiramus]|nr:Tubulin binding cofactor C-like domain [Trinorchestia longiramus]